MYLAAGAFEAQQPFGQSVTIRAVVNALAKAAIELGRMAEAADQGIVGSSIEEARTMDAPGLLPRSFERR